MSHSSTRINYNRLSRWYDWLSGTEKQFSDIGAQMLKIQSGENVLEIGFGTGRNLVTLAYSLAEGGSVYGIDLSEGMIKVARKTMIRNRISNCLNLVQGDGVKLPFTTGFFNAIFISFTLELFIEPEITIVLNECKRVLCNNGRLAIVSLMKKDSLAVHIYDWIHNRLPSIVDCRPIPVDRDLTISGFELVETMQKDLWGLPIVMILAMKHD